MDAVLDIRDLRIDYAGVTAVRDLTLRAEPGMTIALVGPNGAGKTSLLRATAGLVAPTTGGVRILGYDVQRDAEAARSSLGFVPDVYPLYDGLTAFEFLDHFAAAYRVPAAKARVGELLEAVGLAAAADRLCAGLSRGMRQRLFLAKTLLHDPALFVLDEPTSGLDPDGRRDFARLLEGLRRRGRTVVVSSHQLSELAGFATHVAMMDKGRLVHFGAVDAAPGAETGTLEWLLRVRDAGPELVDQLAAYPGVSGVERRETVVRFAFTGGEDALEGLLAALLRAGVRVREWRAVESALERMYFSRGFEGEL